MSEASEKSKWVVNTTDMDFEAIVFNGSRERLVIVDFWAEWCAPCRALGPVLEKLAVEFDGKFLLAKANTDEAMRAAAEFEVSGIPAVFAILDGNPIDSFQGVMPEAALRDWINKQLAGTLLLDAKRLVATDPVAAEAKFREILEHSPNDSNALIPLAELLLAQKRIEECQAIIQQLEKRGFLESAAEKLKAALELGSKAGMNVEVARTQAEADPKNYELQLRLAEVLAGHQRYEEAFEICLLLVAADRKQTGEKARALMVDVFRVLPEDSELTRDYRRKLSMALY